MEMRLFGAESAILSWVVFYAYLLTLAFSVFSAERCGTCADRRPFIDALAHPERNLEDKFVALGGHC